MTNSTQTLNPNQKQQAPKDSYANQNNAEDRKIGNNIEKDEPRAQNRSGGMKDEAKESWEKSQA